MAATRDRIRGVLVPILTLLGLVLLWQVVVRAFRIPTFLLPAPTDVWGVAVTFGPHWGKHLWATVRATFLGFGIATGLGILLAIAIVHSRVLSQIITPVIVLLQIIPKIAFAPLFLIWFGIGSLPIVVVTFLVAFFPMVVNTAIGLTEVEPDMLDLTRVLRMSRWRVLWTIRFPGALPHVFGGLRVASTLAVIGAIIGEFVGSNVGLGYLVLIANNNMNTPLAIASIALISAFGLLLYGGILLLERLSMPWKPPEPGLAEARL
jgi:NitT/TauT family transport system permease protein